MHEQYDNLGDADSAYSYVLLIIMNSFIIISLQYQVLIVEC